MKSVFVLLAQALESLCLQDPPVAPAAVTSRDRLKPIVREYDQALVITFEKTAAQRADIASGPTDWATEFRFELYKRAAANEVPSDAVDPMLVALFARLSGAGEALGLGVEDVMPDPRITWDLGDGQTPLVCATVLVRVLHRTEAAQLVAWA